MLTIFYLLTLVFAFYYVWAMHEFTYWFEKGLPEDPPDDPETVLISTRAPSIPQSVVRLRFGDPITDLLREDRPQPIGWGHLTEATGSGPTES